MFKENKRHLQNDLFSAELMLPEKKLKKLRSSSEYAFYKLIFSNIDEERFSVLYSDKKSRPNAPVNAMVSALILQQHKGWTYEHLFDQIDFDLKTRAALGLQTLSDTPFVPSTLFNFQNSVNEYWIREGINLFETVFDSLTRKQLKELNIKTDIGRSDSFLVASNIRTYSRVQLLVEVLIRLHRILSDKDKEKYSDLLSVYVKNTSGKYIYGLKREELPHELEKLAKVYHELYHAFKSRYGSREIFKIFTRVYEEHFTVVSEKVIVKPPEMLHSGMLQSPDDKEASYRDKRGKKSQGHVISITETANPDNSINLLTDVCVEANNVDDSELLQSRIGKIKAKMPDIKELHTDGGYGSEANDQKMEEENITHVQTAVRGKDAAVPMKIEQRSAGQYEVSCPEQTVMSSPGRVRHKVVFDIRICDKCPLTGQCPARLLKRTSGRAYYFSHADYLSDKRRRAIDKIPEARRKLRPNVEATVKEFTSGMNHKGKLKVRGRFKTEMYAYTSAIFINFGRIYRNIMGIPGKINGFFYHTFVIFHNFGFSTLYVLIPNSILAKTTIIHPKITK